MTDDLVAKYRNDGFVVVLDVLGREELSALRQVIGELVDGAASVDFHTDVYDLEPGHSRGEPRVRRIKSPHKVQPVFDKIVRKAEVMISSCPAGAGYQAVRLEAEHEIRAVWLAGRMAPGLGILSPDQ